MYTPSEEDLAWSMGSALSRGWSVLGQLLEHATEQERTAGGLGCAWWESSQQTARLYPAQHPDCLAKTPEKEGVMRMVPWVTWRLGEAGRG